MRKNHRCLLLVLSALLLSVAIRAEKLPLKSFTMSDGLAHDRVNRIVKDSRGFLWFCTSEGISRFDSYEFKNYTQDDGLPHRSIFDFLETKTGEFWIATGDGVVLFDPLGSSKREWTDAAENPQPMFRVFRPAGLNDNEAGWSVYDLFESADGAIWIASSSGIYTLRKQGGWQLESFGLPAAAENKNQEFTRILADRRGAIWAGGDPGLYRILPDKSSVETVDEKMPVQSILEDRDGQIWVGNGGGGGGEAQIGLHVFAYDGDEPQPIRTFRKRDGLSDDFWINDLLETAGGRILVGVGNGFCEYQPQTDSALPQFRVLANEGVVSEAEDRSGNIWFSTNSSGVRRLTRGGFVNFDESDNLTTRSVGSIIASSDGETYVLTGGFKINRFNGKNFDTVAPRGMIAGSWGSGQITFRDHLGAWWVAGTKGLQRYPPVARLVDLTITAPLKTYTTADGLWTDEIFRLYEDSRGDIWISSIGGIVNTLSKWERRTETIRRFAVEDNLPKQNGPTAFAEDRAGNLWIGFYSGGLVRFKDGKFESFNAADGLPAGYIYSIFKDSSDRIWVATSSGGAVRIDDPASESKPTLKRLTTIDGLSSNQATCVTEDNFHRIYIGTGRGVNRLDLTTGRVKIFTKADGLPENIIRQCRRDAAGALWFGTSNGLARFEPLADERSEPPPIFIADVRANGAAAQKMSALGETATGDLNLESDQRQIQIDFFALGFSTGENLRYQYKLDGIDADWSEPTLLRTVNLNLSPGKYHFLVRAVNSDGEISPVPAAVSLFIARPFWQRWWFLTLAALVVGFLVYALYSYRLRRLLELERVRTRLATDLHDDIGSSLSQIAILSEVVRQKIGDTSANRPLDLIAETSREMVDSMSDIVWAINPQKDHLSDLVHRMRRFASDILDAKDIAYHFHFDENHRDVSLGADIRREVYLIFKEAINNLSKYADASEVEMTARSENNSLVVTVKDNGKGFELGENLNGGADGFGGNGLINMRRRTESLGGRFEIESAKNTGTKVQIKIPV